EVDAARVEIQRRMLAAGRGAQQAADAGSTTSRWAIAVFMAVAVPAIALGVYSQIGTPNLREARLAAGGDAPLDEADIERLVAQLAAGVANEPDNAEGVALLARTYRRLGRYAEAANAFKQLVRLQPDADTYSSLGEALIARD